MSGQVWQVGSDDLQASMLGRAISRGGQAGGRVTTRIGYTRRDGTRVIRKWDKNGKMVEEEQNGHLL